MTPVDVLRVQPSEAQRFLIDAENPWPGLPAFDEAAHRYFNGRQKEAAELRRLVLYAPLTVVFGASGLGKTSLLQAGLFPLLRMENILPIYVRLDVRNRTAPLINQIRQAMLAQFQIRGLDAPNFRGTESLWEWLHREGLELWSARNQLLSPLFVFDQFEEVFTLGAENPDAVAGLRRDLGDLAENRIPAAVAGRLRTSDAEGAELSLGSQRYKVLLSLREDFLPSVENWKRDIPSLMRNRLRLLPMSGEQAFEAVHTTAPHLASESMAREIVRFVAAAQEERLGVPSATGSETELAVEPALLSLVCQGLNERRKAQGKIAFDRALLQGTGQAIISDYYREAVGDLPERVQRFIETELITERGFRKPCDVDDARSVHGITDLELQLLIDRRLLRIEPQQGTERVELTHDLLTRVVREHRDRRRGKESERRQRRRVAAAAVAGVVLAGLVVVFGLLYRSAERERRVAEEQRTIALARQLAIRSRVVVDSPRIYPLRPGSEPPSVLGALLAVEAMRRLHRVDLTDPEVGLAMQRSLELLEVPPVLAPIRPQRPITAIAMSPGFELLAVGVEDGALVWQWPPGDQPLAEVGHALPTSGLLRVITQPDVSFSPDGRRVVTSYGGRVDVWSLDPTGPRLLKQLIHTTMMSPTTARFSVDSRYVATTSFGSVRIWEWQSNKAETNLALNDDAFDAAFSPDGHSLVIATALSGVVVRPWPLGDAGAIRRLDHGSENVRGLTFTADGRLLATRAGNRVRLWAWPGNRDRPLSVLNHGNFVTAMRFSRDGRYLATATQDGLTRVWEVKSGQELIRMPHPSSVQGVEFDREGRYLLTADTSLVRVWSWRPADLIALVCSHLTRNLSLAEWERYLGDEVYAKTCDHLPIDRNYVATGKQLAADGDLEGAIAIFRRANRLDASLRLEPETEARQALVAGLKVQAEAAVSAGDFEDAKSLYRRAAALDPKVQIKPEETMRKTRAQSLVQNAGHLAREYRLREAIEAVTEARRLDPKVAVQAEDWNQLCWLGSLNGHAAEVLDACDRAVGLEPQNGGYRDSRGLARALTGNYRAAAEDFTYFVGWGRNRRPREELRQREAWIEQLNVGHNPFDSMTLEKLGAPTPGRR